MKKSELALIGIGVTLITGIVYYGVKYLKKKNISSQTETQTKAAGDQPETHVESESTEDEQKTPEPIANELCSKDLTISDTKERYVQSNNAKMLLVTQKTEELLQKSGIIPELVQTRTIWELCELVSKKNKDLKERLTAQLTRMRGSINRKPGRTYFMFVPLKDEPAERLDEMAFTIKFTHKHIKEGLDRLNAVIYKYRDSTYLKLYEEHYIELLYYLLVQSEDYKNVGKILPSMFITHPDVNLIGEIVPNRKYNQYLKWYLDTYGQEELDLLLTEDRERYLVDWVGKDPLKNHLQTTDVSS